DLMLAGHLHGGQVRVPMFGAIFSPSLRGVRYASGVFSAAGTVMHVSSGTGSLTPLRYYCPPEISLLTLAPRDLPGCLIHGVRSGRKRPSANLSGVADRSTWRAFCKPR